MKKIIILFLILSSINVQSQKVINLDKNNGIYFVPCKINGVPMRFIFDTGATNVSISITEAKFLIKQGLLTKNDLKETVKYQIANGEIKEGTRINLREIEIYGLKIYNVIATIVYEQDAPLLLGISALKKLGKIEIKNEKLYIFNNEFKSLDKLNLDIEISETIDNINAIFVKYNYETKEVIQKQQVNKIIEKNGKLFLIGVRIEETNSFGQNWKKFEIPVDLINNIAFNEKIYNYWMEIKMKKNVKHILLYTDEINKYYTESLDFIFNKSIKSEKDNLENLFEYLIKLCNKKTLEIESKNGEKVISTDGKYYTKYFGSQDAIGSTKAVFTSDNILVSISRNIPKFRVYEKLYYPNGNIKSEYYINSINNLFGPYKYYYENGLIKVIGELNDSNIKIGNWKWYKENGELDKEIEYRVTVIKHENGNTKEYGGEFYDNKSEKWLRSGEWTFYNDNLQKIKTKYYKFGVETEKKE
ncbi:TIGR02281 family clan AA aspartic protease [Polaribacter sp.]|uniref:TIGR02281 family clan AA aspartic protease n=1 Tax=Polaribacter sp. TaxID=1920175 RepID=UPI00404778A5